MKQINGSGAPVPTPLEDTQTYTVGKMAFIVEPVFRTDAKDSLGTVLLRLIQSDREMPEK